MDSRKLVLTETGVIAAGEALCVAAMLGVFALLGRFDRTVLVGGLVGGLLATLNFFFMALGLMLAADKAEAQDVKGGKGTVRLSYVLRLLLLALLLFAFYKSGLCNPFALVIPLIFIRPILTVAEFFRKAGGPKA